VRKNALLQTALRQTRARKLLRRFHAVDLIFFTDKNIFIVVQEWPRLCATDDKRNANWVINFIVGFCCVMFMSTVALLGVLFCFGYN